MDDARAVVGIEPKAALWNASKDRGKKQSGCSPLSVVNSWHLCRAWRIAHFARGAAARQAEAVRVAARSRAALSTGRI